MYTEEKGCRVCGKELVPVLDLGEIYPSNFVDLGQKDLEPAPLVLAKCSECNLVQLKHTVNLDDMYRQYWYKSGLNDSMVASLRDIVNTVEPFLQEGDTVIDIGCNDGTMLAMFPDYVNKVGFDPAYNLAEEAKQNCDLFINDYFAYDPNLPKAKIITAIAMFYDLPDPQKFMGDILRSLRPDGMFVVQFMDLENMLATNGFDNICFEHLEYYSVPWLVDFIEKFGLGVYDIRFNEVNGGSVRIYAGFGESGMQAATHYNLDAELLRFSLRAEEIKKVVTDYVRQYDFVAVLGASTKGNTTLQYFGLNDLDIHHAAEINEDKFGKLTVGTNIPIISQEQSLALNPEVYLTLPWHFASNFIRKFDKYLEGGGELLVPMPNPAVITKEEGEVKWMRLG